MDLRTLRNFVTVAHEENITRAAAQLFITQPALSRQMQQLENELRVRLFERSVRHSTLTAEGRLFLRRAEEMLALMEKTREELSSTALKGTLSLGMGEFATGEWLARAVTEFLTLHPGVNCTLFEGNSTSVKELLQAGLLDFGVLLSPVDSGNLSYIKSPLREQWGVLVHVSSPLAALEGIDAPTLASEPLIVSERPEVLRELGAFLGQDLNKLSVRITGNLPYNLIACARHLKAPFLTLKKEHVIYPNLTFVPLQPALFSSCIVAFSKGPRSPLVNAFLAHLEKLSAKTA